MKQNLDEKITKLFYKLLNMVPTNIKNRSLIYNVEDEQISITWCVKREKDKSDSSCVEYNIVPFNRAECKYNFAFFSSGYMWDINNSAELDGYTFYINTPVCQFKVPELSRKQLIEVQDIIETYYDNHIPNYLNSLLKDENK